MKIVVLAGGLSPERNVSLSTGTMVTEALRALGYRVLFTPYAELYHYESKSRGLDTKGPARERFEGERRRMKRRYGESLLRDPFYNPNLTLDREDFSESDALPKDDPVPGVPARG